MESRSPKVKLSKHLLEMKFMKRSALRLEKEAHETEQQLHVDDDHWVLDVPGLQEHQNKYVLERSFVTCENLMWGRMAFKNFNPEIEKLMKSKSSEKELANAEERERELGVSDAEMVNRYSTLVNTVGKKFSRKRKRVEESDSDNYEMDTQTDKRLVETSEMIGSTLAQLRKETNNSSVCDIEKPSSAVGSSLHRVDAQISESRPNSTHSTSRKSSKKSPAVLDYYKNKSKSKGFMKPKE